MGNGWPYNIFESNHIVPLYNFYGIGLRMRGAGLNDRNRAYLRLSFSRVMNCTLDTVKKQLKTFLFASSG